MIAHTYIAEDGLHSFSPPSAISILYIRPLLPKEYSLSDKQASGLTAFGLAFQPPYPSLALPLASQIPIAHG
jgi:hypothetical protein